MLRTGATTTVRVFNLVPKPELGNEERLMPPVIDAPILAALGELQKLDHLKNGTALIVPSISCAVWTSGRYSCRKRFVFGLLL